ncbi:MAG: hypothetical protein JWP83_5695 [Mycobacterium sp.]|jgi:hypothetical protein|nr:hypothetical protein [Mycobacterium sp.]
MRVGGVYVKHNDGALEGFRGVARQAAAMPPVSGPT